MTRKSKRELREEIDALYEKTPTDEGADEEALAELEGLFESDDDTDDDIQADSLQELTDRIEETYGGDKGE